jgi:hypothetical protein
LRAAQVVLIGDCERLQTPRWFAVQRTAGAREQRVVADGIEESAPEAIVDAGVEQEPFARPGPRFCERGAQHRQRPLAVGVREFER